MISDEAYFAQIDDMEAFLKQPDDGTSWGDEEESRILYGQSGRSARCGGRRAEEARLAQFEHQHQLRDRGAPGSHDAAAAEQQHQQQQEEGGGDLIVPMPGQDRVSASAVVVGTGEEGFQDGAAAAAVFGHVAAMLHLPDGRVLVVDQRNNRIRVLSADLQQVSTVAGDGGVGHQDGAAAQAQFNCPVGLALLPDGRVLVADEDNHRLRVLSADLQQVSTVAGDGERAHQDGAAAQSQFNRPSGLALLPDGHVLVTDRNNHRIRVLSADLQHVSTLAGDGGEGHRDGAAAQAQFSGPVSLALLPDGHVLVADSWNNRIRVLSADLQQVSTVAGDGEYGHRDGAAAQSQFHCPGGLAVLPDGRVLVADYVNACIRVLSADLQQVSTLTNAGELDDPAALALLPDGRLLLGDGSRIRVLEGFPAALLGPKPSYKRPKKTNQQKKKRALAGAASSTGRLVPMRSRSGASSSSMAAAPSSSDGESEEQPGGSAAEAEPLV
jgi:DNA-binding beta-propeller fold protein YncE